MLLCAPNQGSAKVFSTKTGVSTPPHRAGEFEALSEAHVSQPSFYLGTYFLKWSTGILNSRPLMRLILIIFPTASPPCTRQLSKTPDRLEVVRRENTSAPALVIQWSIVRLFTGEIGVGDRRSEWEKLPVRIRT